ncbi:MAG: hypothetical protein WC722_11695 [Rhodospirillales bacterium]
MRKTNNRSNLDSPAVLRRPCDMRDIDAWAKEEASILEPVAHKDVVGLVLGSIDDFIRWPSRAVLLWEGATRNVKYHSYPDTIADIARRSGVSLDRRTNGPAIASFRIAGGERPKRFGSRNGWSVHHLYSGKFPYIDRPQTLHAAYDSCHATQSAGLVAVHPVADQMCDEYPFFAWYLRAKAFMKFGYYPDDVFSPSAHDRYGFVDVSCDILFSEAVEREENAFVQDWTPPSSFVTAASPPPQDEAGSLA